MIKTHDYRVWTGTRMDYDVLVGGHGVFHIEVSEHHDKLEEYKDGVPVMQFTGLYDINKKKIYRHDILFHEADSPASTNTEVVVEWNVNGHWHFKCRQTGFVFGTEFPSWEAEVTGNIHEHPEKLPKFQGIRQ